VELFKGCLRAWHQSPHLVLIFWLLLAVLAVLLAAEAAVLVDTEPPQGHQARIHRQSPL
jgi:uncharacterized membrane protein YdfJ with MMPL/SSD domain